MCLYLEQSRRRSKHISFESVAQREIIHRGGRRRVLVVYSGEAVQYARRQFRRIRRHLALDIKRLCVDQRHMVQQGYEIPVSVYRHAGFVGFLVIAYEPHDASSGRLRLYDCARRDRPRLRHRISVVVQMSPPLRDVDEMGGIAGVGQIPRRQWTQIACCRRDELDAFRSNGHASVGGVSRGGIGAGVILAPRIDHAVCEGDVDALLHGIVQNDGVERKAPGGILVGGVVSAQGRPGVRRRVDDRAADGFRAAEIRCNGGTVVPVDNAPVEISVADGRRVVGCTVAGYPAPYRIPVVNSSATRRNAVRNDTVDKI